MIPIIEKNHFTIDLTRNEDGTLDWGEAPFNLHEDDFYDCPAQPGEYVADCTHEYYYHPGDFFNPAEEGEQVVVTGYYQEAGRND